MLFGDADAPAPASDANASPHGDRHAYPYLYPDARADACGNCNADARGDAYGYRNADRRAYAYGYRDAHRRAYAYARSDCNADSRACANGHSYAYPCASALRRDSPRSATRIRRLASARSHSDVNARLPYSYPYS